MMQAQFALHPLCLLLGWFAQEPTPLQSLPDDDFSPMLLPLMFVVVAVCLVLMGIGVVLALMGIACAAILAALGIVSSSAVVALLRRRIFDGVRAFHYQVCAAVAAPAGVTLLWTASALFDLQMRLRFILPLGVLAGIVAGLSVAGMLDWTARTACRRLHSSFVSAGAKKIADTSCRPSPTHYSPRKG